MEKTLQAILDFAGSLFDVVGVTGREDYGTLLIVGLESTAERDLDDFGRTDDETHLFGFEKHMSPLLQKTISYIRDKGYAAETVGRHGYPREGQLNLKELAIQSGIGKRGKHSVVLHDKYGARLRFAAIKIEGLVQPPAKPARKESGSPSCSHCSICLKVCPVNILEPYRMTDAIECLSRVRVMKEAQRRLVPCDECLKVCPAGTG